MVTGMIVKLVDLLTRGEKRPPCDFSNINNSKLHSANAICTYSVSISSDVDTQALKWRQSFATRLLLQHV